MEKIAIYGKGGIGKSVVATNLSACYALRRLKVLHIGCDPKTDSSVRLMDDHSSIRTLMEIAGDDPTSMPVEQIINKGRLGIDCCESGGPSPGQGCGGRGVAKTIEFLGETGILETNNYDVVIFDVLGDVVCGGFAAPLRKGFAEKVFIIISEEPMALFAANNICKAVCTYSPNDVVLGGVIANLRSNEADRDFLERFAACLNTRVSAVIPRDSLIQEAERQRKTLVEYQRDAATAKVFENLAEFVFKLQKEDIRLPTPMDNEEFFEFIKDGHIT